MLPIVQRAWYALFIQTYHKAEAEAQAERRMAELPAPQAGCQPAVPRADRETIVVLLTAALALTFLNYAGGSGGLAAIIQGLQALGLSAGDQLQALRTHPETAELTRLAHWAGTCLVAYVAIPVLAIKLLIGRPLREYGLQWRGMLDHAWVYGAMLLAMMPAVAAVSFTDGFQAKYPFYRLHEGERLWPGFACWELIYALQFLALEFFFRGFLVHGTRRRLGYYAVLAMTIPYTMIHFQKPLLETLGAVIAGVVLGTLSLKTRSIWWGACLHIAVAYTMDFAALRQQGLL